MFTIVTRERTRGGRRESKSLRIANEDFLAREFDFEDARRRRDGGDVLDEEKCAPRFLTRSREAAENSICICSLTDSTSARDSFRFITAIIFSHHCVNHLLVAKFFFLYLPPSLSLSFALFYLLFLFLLRIPSRSRTVSEERTVVIATRAR